MEEIPIGKGRLLKDGSDIALLSIGYVGNTAAQAIAEAEKEGISVCHYDMRFLKPIDSGILKDAGSRFRHIITVEDGTVVGGLGSAVMEWLNGNGYSATVHRIGIPDRFIKQGSVRQLYEQCGMGRDSIKKLIVDLTE